jgi:tellurite resistance protein
MEDLEVLKAAMSVAVADGRISRSEMGVLKGLAARLGVGGASLDAMLEAAREDDSQADNILIRSKERARAALELLVAEARIDGDISFEERDVIVRIAASLKIVGDEFQSVYEDGIARADRIRNSRTDSG